jgi:hypothetical protein
VKRTPLAQKGTSDTALIKQDIQDTVREIVIIRDGGCIARDADWHTCSGYRNDGELILQYNELIRPLLSPDRLTLWDRCHAARYKPTRMPLPVPFLGEGSMSIHPDTVTIMLDANPPQAAPFYRAIGYAITKWQQVESALCSVFVKVSTCREEQVAAAIFYTFRDFSDKLTLVHCAARLSLSATTELEEWEKLRKRLITSMESRNALAHFHAVWQLPPAASLHLGIIQFSAKGIPIGGDTTGLDPHPPGVSLILRPNSSDPNEKFKGPQPATKKTMKIQEIVNVQRRFNSLEQQGVFGENPADWNADKRIDTTSEESATNASSC